MHLEITEKEADHLLRVIEFFADHNSESNKEELGEVMVMYWRLHRSRQQNTANDS